MKKGAWARSGVHLFSFPLPQSEEGPAGGLRAASFVTLNVLQPPPVPLPPGSYEGEGAREVPSLYACVRVYICASVRAIW